MDRPGQSISLDVQRKHVAAKIKTEQHTINFIEKHPVQNQQSTKYFYFANKLPKRYNYGYRTLVSDLPYKDAKKYSSEWNRWVINSNPTITSTFIKTYRMLPFCLYRLGYKLFVYVNNIRRK